MKFTSIMKHTKLNHFKHSYFFVFFALLFFQTTKSQICSNQTITNRGDGYVYELWQDWGDGCMNINSDNKFSARWNKIGNVLVRKGKRPGVKNQTINYNLDISRAQGNVFAGGHGWTKSPLIEYYIIDWWQDWRPSSDTKIGEMTADGEIYDIYKSRRRNAPNILDRQLRDFDQYWSVRRKKRTSGTITTALHFKQWESKGLKIGSLYEVSFNLEGVGYNSKGSITAKTTMGTSDKVTETTNNQTKPVVKAPFVAGNSNNNVSGVKRMKSTWGGRYATSNNINWSIVREIGKKDWSSQHWKFEHVTGNVYRIKEMYGNRYLQGNNKKGTSVKVAHYRAQENSQKWTVESVGGNKYRIKCAWGGLYITNGNSDWADLKHAPKNDSWDSQIWELEAVTTGNKLNPQNGDSANFKLAIYPNPSQDVLNIAIKGGYDDSFVKGTILDMNGREIMHLDNFEGLNNISVKNLASGPYVVTVQTMDKKLVSMFYRQ